MFRTKVRKAGLQPQFPHFNLRRKKPDWYRLPLKEMTPQLRKQVVGLVRFREKECNFDSRIRPATARSLQRTLLAFLGYCTRILRIRSITNLRSVLTLKNIEKFINWAHDVRGCRWLSVYSMCACIYQLTQTGHQPFTGKAEEYAWFQDLLKRIPREPKDLLRQRKIARIVPYRVFTQIARGIEKTLSVNKNLTPIQRALLYRDYFFCKTIARHPLRGRNWRECRLRPDSQPNLDYDTIPRRVQRDGNLPSWVRKILAVNPDQKFWRCHFIEDETKAKNDIWEVFEPEIVEIFLEYRDVHRKEILGDRPDPGTLLINNAGKPMADGQLGAHLGVLSRKYIGKRVSPHIVRDIVAEHAVVCGCKPETVQRMLGQKNRLSKTAYLSGLNSSHACGALETEFAA